MNAPLIASLMHAGMSAGIALVLALPALSRRGRWLVAVVAVITFLHVFATAWPNFIGTPLDFIGGNWNWSGKLIDFGVLLIVALVFVVTGLFSRPELGLTFKQRAGTWRAMLFVTVPLLVLFGVAVWKMTSHEVPTIETVAYQATMPGLAEELFYRGLLLALFDRMFPPGRSILGAKLGYGAVATSILFASAHAFDVSHSLHVSFSLTAGLFPLGFAFVAVWIRARSGSLAVPVVFHNLVNVMANVIPAFV